MKIIVSSTLKFLRVSPTKLEPILAKIRGKSYREAIYILKTLSRKNGSFVWQTLYTAASDAANNQKLNRDKLVIFEAFANKGPIMKRMQPRARGKAYRIEKKFSHLTISVTELSS